ncbi:hypothetical protein FACS1894184_06160 [Clostridia bacterium]|nr:hypothetical protein FACS1894184_06160 [Clostridia bacterium]
MITPERVAINLDDAAFPDNDGQQPIDSIIIENGPSAYFSSLPIKVIVKSIQEAGLPVTVSNTAGTYVCNHLMYGVMHCLACEYPSTIGGFIHVPYIPQQAIGKPAATPSMSLDNIVRGMEAALDAIVQAVCANSV